MTEATQIVSLELRLRWWFPVLMGFASLAGALHLPLVLREAIGRWLVGLSEYAVVVREKREMNISLPAINAG